MSVARGGRLEASIDLAMEALNTSVDVDSALWREDIQGSIAHARGLGRAGVIGAEEVEALVGGSARSLWRSSAASSAGTAPRKTST